MGALIPALEEGEIGAILAGRLDSGIAIGACGGDRELRGRLDRALDAMRDGEPVAAPRS